MLTRSAKMESLRIVEVDLFTDWTHTAQQIVKRAITLCYLANSPKMSGAGSCVSSIQQISILYLCFCVYDLCCYSTEQADQPSAVLDRCTWLAVALHVHWSAAVGLSTSNRTTFIQWDNMTVRWHICTFFHHKGRTWNNKTDRHTTDLQ